MRAIVLAGGRGRRLAPYTVSFPKPLVPVGDMPILEIVIRQLRSQGFEHITLAVGHLAGLLEAYFGDGESLGVRIDYSLEPRPLGTVGPLTLMEDLPETFLVMNGDVLTTLNYSELFQHHKETGAELTIACHRCNTKIDLGVIEFDGRFDVTGYREKPVIPYDVSMGVYVFNRTVIEQLNRGEEIDFPSAVDRLIKNRQSVKVFLAACRWLDIGRQADYASAQQTFEELRNEFLPQDSSPADQEAVAKSSANGEQKQ